MSAKPKIAKIKLNPYLPQFANIRNRIAFYSAKYGINLKIAIQQIWQESKFNPRSSSGKAHGIAQFTPDTAKDWKVNVWDIESSLDGWGRYMQYLLRKFKGNYSLALAGYNAGAGNVIKAGNQIPKFTETQNYVKDILDAASGGVSGAVQTVADNPKTFGFGTLAIAGIILLVITKS
jgi:soluble lytic murein transglycosylase-like protein